jgi:tetratricopeptide (TPR) repeat protein
MKNLGKLSLVLLAVAAGAAGGMLGQALEPDVQEGTDRAPVAPREVKDLERRVADLEARLAERPSEKDGVRTASPVSPPASTASQPARSATAAEAKPIDAPGAPDDSRGGPEDPLEGILGHAYGYKESRSLFARLSRDHGAIGAVIARLEAEIENNPQSADLYAALATAYSAKTAYDTPPGPEQGVVWLKAEAAFDEAIRLDPEHWEARWGKAFGDSMAPEFVGLRPRAIHEFEDLMAIQERKPLAPEHVEVYVRLGTLYKDAGNPKKAREIWKRGLERFPDESRLTEALALVEEK